MENDTYKEVLLGCSPPLNEKRYTAEELYELLEFVLSIYGKSITSPSVIIGDNCATNKSLAEKVGVPLIGCGCHKLNLAVKAFLARRPVMEKTIERVDKVVSQLRNLKAAGALRLLTPHCALKRNVTRWSSTYKMLERFVSIESAAKELDDIDPIRRADSDRIKEVLPTLENFKSIMTDLQKQGQHIGVVHETFQMMVVDYPDYASLLRDRKRQRLTTSEDYEDLRFISGTSASAERLFSSAKHVLRSTRKRLTPVNFENLLFFKHNRHLWNADMVSQAMKAPSSTES
eukprot:jgi/Phyca11/551860/estExt2_Genewise1Plus.C_PHYCAscaffold_440030